MTGLTAFLLGDAIAPQRGESGAIAPQTPVSAAHPGETCWLNGKGYQACAVRYIADFWGAA